jgi:hypothetical protein
VPRAAALPRAQATPAARVNGTPHTALLVTAGTSADPWGDCLIRRSFGVKTAVERWYERKRSLLSYSGMGEEAGGGPESEIEPALLQCKWAFYLVPKGPKTLHRRIPMTAIDGLTTFVGMLIILTVVLTIVLRTR